MEEKKYPIGGYAPGEYWHKACNTCGKEFHGDKRAWNCEPCGEIVAKQEGQPGAGFAPGAPQTTGTYFASIKPFAGEKDEMVVLHYQADKGVYYAYGLHSRPVKAEEIIGHIPREEHGMRVTGAVWVKATTWPDDHNLVHWRRVEDKRPVLTIGRNYQDNIITQFGKVYTPEELEWLDEGTAAAEREESFAEWAMNEGWECKKGKGWSRHSDETPYVLTTAQLYDIFKQQKEK